MNLFTLSFLLMILSLISSSSSSSSSTSSSTTTTTATSTTTVTSKQKKQHKHNKHKRMHGTTINNIYGTELPSFSFDFSDYFISAMIERIENSPELYLTMLILSHNVIDTKSLLSISTEDEVLLQWKYTLKWENDRDYNNFACVIKNNDVTLPYVSHLSWISFNDSTIEILRCRLKGITNTSEITDYSSLSVDIIKKRNKNHNRDTFRNHDQSSAIISFSIPWYKRFVGYGFNFKNSSIFDQWSMGKNDKVKTHVCTSLIRPLNPLMSLTGIPMILEYVEHQIQLGFDHVFLPILLDWNSKYMNRILTILKSYIDNGQVSIVSLSLKGHDDISGFNGIHISNQLSERIFMNSCLYMSKGIAKYVVTSKAHQFIVPITDSIVPFNKMTGRKLESVTTTDVLNHQNIHQKVILREKSKNKKFFSMNSNISVDAIELCDYLLYSFVFAEPEGKNHFIHGPGDDEYSNSYYETSTLSGPHIEQGVHIFLSDFIQSWSSQNIFSCRFPSTSTFSRNNVVSRNYSVITSTVSAKAASVIQYGWDILFQQPMTNNKINNSILISHRNIYWKQSLEKLKNIGYEKIEFIANMKKKSDAIFFENNKEQKIEVGRASMRPPFWILLDKESLRQVLTARYGSK